MTKNRFKNFELTKVLTNILIWVYIFEILTPDIHNENSYQKTHIFYEVYFNEHKKLYECLENMYFLQINKNICLCKKINDLYRCKSLI